jgi:hypothetical protein
MDDLTENPGELIEDRTFQPQLSYRNREINKWKAIARLVDTNSDALPFSRSTSEPERRWAFFSQASGILNQSALRAVDDLSDTSGAVVDIF